MEKERKRMIKWIMVGIGIGGLFEVEGKMIREDLEKIRKEKKKEIEMKGIKEEKLMKV